MGDIPIQSRQGSNGGGTKGKMTAFGVTRRLPGRCCCRLSVHGPSGRLHGEKKLPGTHGRRNAF